MKSNVPIGPSVRLPSGEFDTEVKDGREAIQQVEQVFIHRSYISTTYHNDISLVMLKDPIKFTQFILPACLPQHDFAEQVCSMMYYP